MPVKAMKAPVRAKRSRAEMQQEFAEIQEQAESAREAADAKAEGAARLRAAEVRQAAEGITVEAVVQKISGLGLEVGKALADVSEQLTQEVKVLATVREAGALERKELEQIHKMDVAATALDQIVQDYAREKQRVEAEIGALRQAWEEESARMERERKEQDENLKKQRQRAIEDYEYKKALERKKAQDKYEEEMHLVEKKNQERQEALEKAWRQREAELKDREQELTRLRREGEGFPARLQNEAETAALRVRRETEGAGHCLESDRGGLWVEGVVTCQPDRYGASKESTSRAAGQPRPESAPSAPTDHARCGRYRTLVSKENDGMPRRRRSPLGMQAWIEARKRHHLSHAQVHMACELGMNPAKLGKIDNHRQEPWKAPLPQFIEGLYSKRF